MSFFSLKRKQRFSASWVLCGILSLALAGCGSSSKDSKTGSAEVKVKFQGLSSSDVASIKVTISGDGINPDIEANLTNDSGTWSGTIAKIAAGDNRTFVAQAYDGENALIYKGSATGVTITANNSTVVVILLQQTTPPDQYNNGAPYITSATASTDQVLTDGTISFTVVAADPDDDTLTYSWTATAGTFSAEDTASTTWTAPSTAGSQTISISVSDGKGATAGASFTIMVEEIVGSADVTVSINTWPVISSISVNPGQIGTEETSSIAVVASDSESDTLTYAWSDDCGGTFESASAASTNWTAPSSAPASGSCTLTVNVADGKDGSNSGAVTMKIGKPTIAIDDVPPAEITGLVATTPLTGQVVFTWTDPTDSDFDHVEVSSPDITNPISVAKGVGESVISGLATDASIDITLKSVDTLGNKSTGTTQSITPVVVVIRLKTTYSEGGNPLYVANTYKDPDYPTANDAIMIILNGECTGGADSYLWTAWPGLADPTDSSLISFENHATPGSYLRIDSDNLTRWPESVGQCYGWSLGNVTAPKDHLAFIEPYEETDTFKSDATFEVVPALNGDTALKSLQWYGDSNYYLQHNWFHILGRSGSSINNTDASFTLEQQ